MTCHLLSAGVQVLNITCEQKSKTHGDKTKTESESLHMGQRANLKLIAHDCQKQIRFDNVMLTTKMVNPQVIGLTLKVLLLLIK